MDSNFFNNDGKILCVLGAISSVFTIYMFVNEHLFTAILIIAVFLFIFVGWIIIKLIKENKQLKTRLSDVEEFEAEYKKMLDQGIDNQGFFSIKAFDNRDLAYATLRNSAKQKIVIIGTGMSIIRDSALDSIVKQAEKVDIEIFMIDPYYIKKNYQLKNILTDFFGNDNLVREIEYSYNTIKRACEDVTRNNGSNGHKMELYVYDTLPTIGLAMIDPDLSESQIILEPNLYKTKNAQPRFILLNNNPESSIFDVVKSTYDKIKINSKNAETLGYIQNKNKSKQTKN